MGKNTIIVTGGAGFVGSNLLRFLLIKSKYNIIILDNYSSGTKQNHIKKTIIKTKGACLLLQEKVFIKKMKTIKTQAPNFIMEKLKTQ